MRKFSFFACVIYIVILVACANNDIIVPNPTQKEKVQSVKNITIPVNIVGVPDEIYIMKNKNETIFLQTEDKYGDILGKIKERFPNTLKEASMAILWTDNKGSFDWISMAEDFDYIRLSFHTKQTVILNCFENPNKEPQELEFNDLIFPLSEENGDLFIVGTQRIYGVLKRVCVTNMMEIAILAD